MVMSVLRESLINENLASQQEDQSCDTCAESCKADEQQQIREDMYTSTSVGTDENS